MRRRVSRANRRVHRALKPIHARRALQHRRNITRRAQVDDALRALRDRAAARRRWRRRTRPPTTTALRCIDDGARALRSLRRRARAVARDVGVAHDASEGVCGRARARGVRGEPARVERGDGEGGRARHGVTTSSVVDSRRRARAVSVRRGDSRRRVTATVVRARDATA